MQYFARALLPFLLAVSPSFAHQDEDCASLPPELAPEVAAMRGTGKALESVAHRGHTGCALLHKVVEFDLPAGRQLVLQLSGAADGKVGLVITGPA